MRTLLLLATAMASDDWKTLWWLPSDGEVTPGKQVASHTTISCSCPRDRRRPTAGRCWSFCTAKGRVLRRRCHASRFKGRRRPADARQAR